ncbi:unnamed protein product [Angiostrongylus costaricensis]|uniref:gamma-glutamylcyclotransferase n=1 Tax=Angiostrongylus costaricensis TaxID=334426 RepID=A0A0R3PKJ8_ANGCS|nr:unnamed protein product [Angiostrongylus costaricensis]
MTRFFYYFAYGSNLLKERIRVQYTYRQIKGAEFERSGVLKNYELDFVANSTRWHGGLATIKEKSGAEVYGCVWRVPEEFADELDLQEKGYHRLSGGIHLHSYVNGGRFVNCLFAVCIECVNSVIECRTYQYSDSKAPSLPPSPHYKTVILAGAVENSLPASYVKSKLSYCA